MFSVFCPFSFLEKAKQQLKKWQEKRSRTSTTSAPQDKTIISSKPDPAVISVICCGLDIMQIIKRDLEEILQKQLVEREVKVDDVSRLDDMELEAVQAKVRVLGISLEHRRGPGSQSVNGNRAANTARTEARDRSGSREEVYVLRGLKEDVLSVTELITRAVHEALYEEKEAMLALNVQWSIQDVHGDWNELSLHDNSVLENAHLNNQMLVDVTAPDGVTVKVNLGSKDATNNLTGFTHKVKRSETGSGMSHCVVY